MLKLSVVLSLLILCDVVFCQHEELLKNVSYNLNLVDAECVEDFDTNATNDCHCNPDIFLQTPEIIRRHGYEAESHTIQTEDGYLLTMHRIPSAKNGTKGKQPIFLQHGLLSSSADWVDGGNTSLAFFLADHGYDVWLGNSRGNFYSKGHITLPPCSTKYWQFSWHEMGIYDLPAAIYHISNKTGMAGEIIYVGHSMGTTMFFVFSSKLPQVAKYIKTMVALAPVAYMTHVRSPIKYLTPWVNDLSFITRFLGINQFLPKSKILYLLTRDCLLLNIDRRICENLIFLLCGFDKEQFNTDLLPVIFSHTPAGTSTKTVLHYLQEIANKGDFKQYDYGEKQNLVVYGQKTPPFYKLANIKVPTYLMYGDNDLLASPIDVYLLSKNLTNNIGSYDIPFQDFNHVDFLWAKNATNLVYEPMLEFLTNYSINH